MSFLNCAALASFVVGGSESFWGQTCRRQCFLACCTSPSEPELEKVECVFAIAGDKLSIRILIVIQSVFHLHVLFVQQVIRSKIRSIFYPRVIRSVKRNL